MIDLCRLLPGDFATWILADLGAEVIKVEDTAAGDYMRWMPPMAGHSSAMYNSINRGKRAIKLDLKDERAKDALRRLVETADVLVEGFRPGVMDRLGLGYASLRARRPGLVYCAITGYGQYGPYAQRAGHDLDYISLTGLQGITGTADGTPGIPGFQVADLGAGGLGAALSVVAALVGRSRDPAGLGTFLDVSMFDGAAAMVAPHVARHLVEPGPAAPSRMHLNGRYPCYRLYQAGDGRWMALAALEPKFWMAFCGLVERPDLVERQFEDSEDAHTAVAAVVAARSREEWIAAVAGHDVCLEPVNTLEEAVADPHFQARGLLVDGEGMRQPAPLVRLPGGSIADTHVAAPGEDTDRVLGELGYSGAEIEQLHRDGVI